MYLINKDETEYTGQVGGVTPSSNQRLFYGYAGVSVRPSVRHANDTLLF